MREFCSIKCAVSRLSRYIYKMVHQFPEAVQVPVPSPIHALAVLQVAHRKHSGVLFRCGADLDVAPLPTTNLPLLPFLYHTLVHARRRPYLHRSRDLCPLLSPIACHCCSEHHDLRFGRSSIRSKVYLFDARSGSSIIIISDHDVIHPLHVHSGNRYRCTDARHEFKYIFLSRRQLWFKNFTAEAGCNGCNELIRVE